MEQFFGLFEDGVAEIDILALDQKGQIRVRRRDTLEEIVLNEHLIFEDRKQAEYIYELNQND